MTMTKDFTIEYSGESQEVDLNVLLTSLISLSAAIQEIKSAVAAPEVKVDVKVKPFGEGSFLVYLAIHTPDLLPLISSLFSRETVSLAENILSIFSNTLNLKNFLGGQPIKSSESLEGGQQVLIENNEGQVMQIRTDVLNVYVQNPRIDGLLSKSFEALNREDNVSGFRVLDSNQTPLAQIPKESFEAMSRPAGTITGEERKVVKENVWVQATKLSFEVGVPWELVYDGNKIKAKVTDEQFYKRIEANERFAKGDTFCVRLQVTQRYDKSSQAYLNKAGSYEILSVLEHKEAPIQGDLFSDAE
jgi:hypothetical protein